MPKQSKTPSQSKHNQKKNSFWNFTVNEATETKTESVELRIQGDIVEDDDAWLYEWFGADSASPNAFRNELSGYTGQDITVWIDSYGGSVFAAAGIYNALQEHDGNVTVKIDGKAMSAASIIAMAGDEILMSPVAIMMIHNPLSSAAGYASDLRKTADVLDEIKATIINAYQLKTGLPSDKISSLMDGETYMSAKTAIKDGFADGMLYSNDDETDEPNDVMNFSFNRLAIQNSATAAAKRFFEFAKTAEEINRNQPGATAGPPAAPEDDKNQQEVNDVMEIKNMEDLKAQLPDVHNGVYSAGVAAERERLKAFDVLNGKVDSEYLASAKYEDGATAESVLFKAMQEGKLINAGYVAQAEKDAESANQVPGAASDNTKPDEVTGVLNKVASIAQKTLGIGGKA
jgi:ATP-dependent protease ClpP protease subunit